MLMCIFKLCNQSYNNISEYFEIHKQGETIRLEVSKQENRQILRNDTIWLGKEDRNKIQEGDTPN